jgi:hypothetical protein
MMKMNIIKIVFLIFAWNACAEDLGHSVSGEAVEDVLVVKTKEERTGPFVDTKNVSDDYAGKVGNSSQEDFIVGASNKDLVVKDPEVKKLKSSGYVLPGTFDKEKNYLVLDKKQFAKDFGNQSTSALNLAFISDSFKYQSENDIINRTIGEGDQHVKSGMLQVRLDQYLFKTFALNSFWAVGTGVSYNSGKGTFVTGSKSDAKFALWEVPLDLGIGFEVPLYTWVKCAGVIGPSGMVLIQNRNDFQNGEKGKNKYQFGYGPFLSAQFKMNLSAFNENLAYDLFSSSQITRLSLNLEARYENYSHFQDSAIAISGTSFGVGFTFEFL